MPTSDPRGVRLRLLDAQADNLIEIREKGTPAGEADVAALCHLAQALADSLAEWRPIIARLDGHQARAFDAAHAGTLVIESVFDELLDAPACRVLAAAFDLLAPRS
jgi:hypothetical protein